MRSKIVKRKSKSTPIVQLACYKKKRISPTGQTGLALQRLPIGDTNGAIACSVVKRKAFSRGRVPRYLHHNSKQQKSKLNILSLTCLLLWWSMSDLKRTLLGNILFLVVVAQPLKS